MPEEKSETRNPRWMGGVIDRSKTKTNNRKNKRMKRTTKYTNYTKALAFAALFPVMAFAQTNTVAVSGVSAPPSVSPWLALIPIAVPVAIALLKKAAPKIPGWLLPIIAPLMGAAADIALNYAGVATLGAGWSALLGSAGVGLREVQDQLKSRVSGPVNQ